MSICNRIKVEPCLTSSTNTNSKWIKDLNIRPKTIKHLKENTVEKLYDTRLGHDFLDTTPTAQATKAKIDTWDNVNLKNSCASKGTVNRGTVGRVLAKLMWSWTSSLSSPSLSFLIFQGDDNTTFIKFVAWHKNEYAVNIHYCPNFLKFMPLFWTSSVVRNLNLWLQIGSYTQLKATVQVKFTK